MWWWGTLLLLYSNTYTKGHVNALKEELAAFDRAVLPLDRHFLFEQVVEHLQRSSSKASVKHQ